jgi:Cys-tRNA(Pro)/Cys-tRNA(Cys) deacylase
VIADDALTTLDRVCVSAGVRGMQMVLAPADYVRATGCKLAPIVRAS